MSSEKFRTFAVGKDKGLEFYRKIFELAPLALQVSRCFWGKLSFPEAFWSTNRLRNLQTPFHNKKIADTHLNILKIYMCLFGNW